MQHVLVLNFESSGFSKFLTSPMNLENEKNEWYYPLFFFFQSLESRRTVCQLYEQDMQQSQLPSLKVGKMPVNMSIDRAGGYNNYKYMCKITSSLFPWWDYCNYMYILHYKKETTVQVNTNPPQHESTTTEFCIKFVWCNPVLFCY